MRVEASNGASVELWRGKSEREAMYYAVSLLNTKTDIPLFWVEGPDGAWIADPKGISDYADGNGYPNAWREAREDPTWTPRRLEF